MPPMSGMSAASSAGSSGFDFGSILSSLPALGGMADSIFGGSDDKAATKLAKKQFKFLQRMATAGSDNGRGLRTYYDKASNTWKVDLGGISGQLQDASNADELQRLQVEEPRNAQSRYQNSMQRADMRPIIDTLTDKLQNQTDVTPDALQGDLNYLSNSALDDVYGKVQGDIARNAIRTPGAFQGRSGPMSSLVSNLAKQKSDAMVENRLKSLTGAEELNSAKTGNKINQINSLSANAFNFDDIPFAPSQLDTQGSSLIANQRGSVPQYAGVGLSGLLSANRASDSSNMFGDIGTGLSSILSAFGSKPSTDDTKIGNQTYSTSKSFPKNPYSYSMNAF